ncbi:hypothetical protein [Sciscionella sediminilitoris]|uniref:hypothetical protein n=1 Tax=Sciscionella sediminilitoris TaxID=1445613 RepID=UPI0004DF3B9A|nr:hypothetical protein [Sciscionella sp. SE31]
MPTGAARQKIAPRELTSTELKSQQMDVWDDARAGHVTFIVRGANRRPVAAIVPVEVGYACEQQEELSGHERARIAAAVEQAQSEISGTLERLAAEVADTSDTTETAGVEVSQLSPPAH